MNLDFYLGTHIVHWLWTVKVPLFMSHRRLIRNQKLYPALSKWALDSGGFSELSMYGEWKTSKEYYLESIFRYHENAGKLKWAAPQDWMCEPFIIEKTKLSVKEHQIRTIDSFLWLSERSPVPIIPILQGFEKTDYLEHVDMYSRRGITLEDYPTVGIGSVCRRQGTKEIEDILESLIPIKLHGFGVKKQGLPKCVPYLVSADSMAWSFNARKNEPLPHCKHRKCSNCLDYALKWRKELLASLSYVPKPRRYSIVSSHVK